MTQLWPEPIDAVEDFYGRHLKLPLALFADLQQKTAGKGSARPHGSRSLLWQSTGLLAVAALEAGLEELCISTHGHVTQRTGRLMKRDWRKLLVEAQLATPGPRKLSLYLAAHFGVVIEDLPPSAQFELRKKTNPKGTAAKGQRVRGPVDWDGLSKLHSSLMHIRNGLAHGDTVKLAAALPEAEGLLWVRLAGGGWSIQQPHGLNAIRTVTSVFNAAASAIDDQWGIFDGTDPLKSPNELVAYGS